MYLPRDISRELKRRVNACSIEELYYAANNQKIADKKKANYQEALEKSRADSATRSRDNYMKDPEKSRAQRPRKLYEGSGRVVLTLQHEAAKFTRKTWRRIMSR